MSIDAMSSEPGGSVDVDDQVADIAGVLNVHHAQLARIVASALADESWQRAGIHTPVQWLGLKAGLTPSHAKQVVAVAERAAEFPKLMTAFDAGAFTIDQVSIVMKAPAWADDHVLEFAEIATLSQLRRAMHDRFFEDDAPATDTPAPRDRLSFGVTSDGDRWRISGEFNIADGRRIEAALIEAKDSLFERGDEHPTWCDALVEVAERSLDAVPSTLRRDRFRTWLHLDVSSGVATTTDGWRIPQPVADRILCDGALQPVWEREGVPFNAGRTQRIVSDRLRRLVERRDGGCRVPGCTNQRWVEVHHIVAWADGGRTDTCNLVSLCPKHHRAHHQGEFTISGDPDRGTLEFIDAEGRPVGTRRLRPAPGRHPQPPSPRYRGPLGESMDWQWFGGWVHPNVLARRREQRQQYRQDDTPLD